MPEHVADGGVQVFLECLPSADEGEAFAGAFIVCLNDNSKRVFLQSRKAAVIHKHIQASNMLWRVLPVGGLFFRGILVRPPEMLGAQICQKGVQSFRIEAEVNVVNGLALCRNAKNHGNRQIPKVTYSQRSGSLYIR